MSSEMAWFIALAALACSWGFHAGRLAATEHPLTWGPVFGAALMLGIGWLMTTIFAPTSRASLLASGAYLFAVTIGANRGIVQRDRRLALDQANERRLLAWLATLGPCVECGSGDLQRRPCDGCGRVYCASCSMRHQPYRNATKSPCPASAVDGV